MRAARASVEGDCRTSGEIPRGVVALPNRRYGRGRRGSNPADSSGNGAVEAARSEKTSSEGHDMTNSCPEWTERLMDAALSNEVDAALGDHLKRCERGAAAPTALRRRRGQLSSPRPLQVRGAQQVLGFRARVLAATE